MLQREVADELGVDETTICNWEANRAAPELLYIPKIIRFLGFNPLPTGKTLAEQLVRHRTTLGMSQKETAVHLAVDQGTMARWERGEREPKGVFLEAVIRFLAS
jgi:DNA-binding transcriptional regulator YiaG